MSKIPKILTTWFMDDPLQTKEMVGVSFGVINPRFVRGPLVNGFFLLNVFSHANRR